MSKQKTVVLTALYMNNYSGSVFVVSEFAMYFANLGYKVYIFTFHKDKKVVQSMCNSKNVKVINIKKRWVLPKIRADLMMGLHCDVFDTIMKSRRITGDKIVYFSLSPYDNAERIPAYYDKFTKIYCNSWETAKIRSAEVSNYQLDIFNNSVAPEFIKNRKLSYNKNLKKVAVVSNHGVFLPGSDFHKHALTAGLDITFFGIQSENSKKITPDDLLDFDVIISIGRTVQYALCLGIPVFCYDRFGGPGYITLDNWADMEKMNYSGRKKPISNKDFDNSLIKNLDAKSIIDDLINGYPAVLKDVEQLRKIAVERYDLYKNLDNLMCDIGEECNAK